jgi:hypothetical protein
LEQFEQDREADVSFTLKQQASQQQEQRSWLASPVKGDGGGNKNSSYSKLFQSKVELFKNPCTKENLG